LVEMSAGISKYFLLDLWGLTWSCGYERLWNALHGGLLPNYILRTVREYAIKPLPSR